MVIVQPSVYGTGNACSLDAAARFGLDRARVVAVVDEGFDDAALRDLHARGTRGVRFNAVSGNGTPLDQPRRWRDASPRSAGTCRSMPRAASCPTWHRASRTCRSRW